MGEFPLLVAGEAGQASLARSADSYRLRACVDQHVAEVREALDGRITEGLLLSYARGFVEVAVARGWWPPHRRPDRGPAIESLAGPSWDPAPFTDPAPLTHPAPFTHPAAPFTHPAEDLIEDREWHPDWESLRLAAVCHLFLETQGLVPG
jgi:hypothetical protein